MNHSHIARLFGAFIRGGADASLCLLLEFAAGGSLAEDIRHQRETGQGYDSTMVISWMAQLAMAVRYMHRRNVLHRDISSGARYSRQ